MERLTKIMKEVQSIIAENITLKNKLARFEYMQELMKSTEGVGISLSNDVRIVDLYTKIGKTLIYDKINREIEYRSRYAIEYLSDLKTYTPNFDSWYEKLKEELVNMVKCDDLSKNEIVDICRESALEIYEKKCRESKMAYVRSQKES